MVIGFSVGVLIIILFAAMNAINNNTQKVDISRIPPSEEDNIKLSFNEVVSQAPTLSKLNMLGIIYRHTITN